MAETEKITINMGMVDLGKIDLLVQEGFYQNRTDFIRTAIRSQLDKHEAAVQSSVIRNSYGMGIFEYARKDFERWIANGEKRNFSIIGMLTFDEDITPELADLAVSSVRVRGTFRASEAVKAILKDRTQN